MADNTPDPVLTFIGEAIGINKITKYDEFILKLEKLGVNEFEHLEFVNPEVDFEGYMSPIAARILKKKIDIQFAGSSSPNLTPSATSSTPPTTPLRTPDVFQLSTPKSTNLEFFMVPWQQILSQGTIEHLEAGRVLESHIHNQFIQSLSLAIFETNNHPSLASIVRISQVCTNKYPTSFQPYLNNGVLANQIKNRIDTLNRKKNLITKRKLEMLPGGGVQEKKKGRPSKKDRFGCSPNQWSVDVLPEGDEAETIQTKALWLKDEHQKKERDAHLVKEYMEDTYALQRLFINGKPPIREVQVKWPFLFEDTYITAHFKRLMGHDEDITMQNIANEVPIIRSYFRLYTSANKSKAESVKTKCNAIRDILDFLDNVDMPLSSQFLHVLRILAIHFNESLKWLYLEFEETIAASEIIETPEIPLNPFVAVNGDLKTITTDPCCLVVVERVPFENLRMTPFLATMTMFKVYYVFNIVYPIDICCTLEFIQCRIMNISGDGNKVARGKGQQHQLRPKLSSLVSKLQSHKKVYNL